MREEKVKYEGRAMGYYNSGTSQGRFGLFTVVVVKRVNAERGESSEGRRRGVAEQR